MTVLVLIEPKLGSAQTFAVTSATTSAATVTPGHSITLTASVTSSSASANMVFDMELYNSAGSKLAQQFYTGVNFSAGQTLSESWNYAVPSNWATGPYTLKIGIFTANWATLDYWDNNAATFTVAAALACGTHASGSTYTLMTGTTTGSTTPTVAACPYGGSQPTTTTTTQTYSCTNGVQTAQGSPVSTTTNSGTPICNAPLACGTHASGSTYTLTTGTTTGTTTPTVAACPYGGSQPTTTTTTQTYSCTNGVQTAQGSPVSTTVDSGAPTCASSSTGPFGIKILGNKFVSTKDNSVIQLLGVSVSGLEQGFTAFNPNPSEYNNATNPGFSEMASWNINLVRIPLNEDTWLGINNCTLDGGTAAVLHSNLQQAVANANAAGLYVILDLHWSAPQSFGCPGGQGSMPDADHTAAFWSSVANTFKSNPAVMFEIFNEPFGTNVYDNWVAPIASAAPAGQSASDLSILLNGGTYYDGYNYQCNLAACTLNNGQIYLAPGTSPFQTGGMQTLVNAIRATGATNVIISNAMGWAGEIQTWLGAQPTDPLGQLAAGWHEDGGGSSTAASAQAVLNAGYPIIITEAYNNGANATGYVDAAGVNLFNWATSNNVGYSYWAWVDWSGGILVDTQSYAPNALGSSLRTSYCSQPKVNSLATCP